MNLSENQESLQILEQIAEQTDQVFFIYDIQRNNIRYLNPSFDEIWGRSRQHIMDNPALLLETVHPEDQEYVRNSLTRISKREQQVSEFRIVSNAQQEKWISVRTYAIYNPDKSWSIAGFAEDVTDKKAKHHTLLKFSERKNSILHSFSHELAGPLALIQSLSSSLEGEKADSEVVHETLGYIQETCKKSISLIKELLNNEFLESSGVTVRKTRFNLLAKTHNSVTMFRQADFNARKNIKLISSHDPLFIVADEVTMMQVIHNLIANALKFTHEGGNITVTLLERENTVLLSVHDDGIGIPKDLQPYVFDKFTKARRPGLRGEETVGLGLSIVKNIVELHQGRIWVTSEENQGSTFFIELPKE
ncbi:PAS domain-containing sensor histidine kinase [Adhaeribacter rhizoryzae]|uniref:histidine kinase n=1 Tax=Adhaeribacter rhizoryzae TaxID=2607907 RepID=A0A5M6D7K7_9BACT|nr:PAS domain-containing sensor histidine kinase [Adhaeribacter rhizoryzae]KAA5542460.1 PAS domain-containing protein [Adhaeribacter rhizoryzae]